MAKEEKKRPFNEVLEADEKIMEIKRRLEAAKEVLVDINSEMITRMRELMAEDSGGKVGQPKDEMFEISMLILTLSNSLKEEVGTRTMDKLVPGWEQKAIEDMMESIFSPD